MAGEEATRSQFTAGVMGAELGRVASGRTAGWFGGHVSEGDGGIDAGSGRKEAVN